jgi:DNA polymerase-4
MVAKIASDLGKPDGLVVVDDVDAFLRPLPVARLWGVGEVTARSLAERGVRTFADLIDAGEAALAASIGKETAARLVSLARGEDERPVDPGRAAVSIGAEETFDHDLRDRAALAPYLLAQADRACARARAAGERARTITVKVKYADHELVTRRTTLPRATADGRVVGRAAVKLLDAVPAIERRGVRLTGVSLSGLEAEDAPRQLDFDNATAERGERLGKTIDEIAARFGGGMIKRAVHVPDDED